jgi:hypothetical protein
MITNRPISEADFALAKVHFAEYNKSFSLYNVK